MFGFSSESPSLCSADFTVDEINTAAEKLYGALDAVSDSLNSCIDYSGKISGNYVELFNSAKEKYNSVIERIREVENDLQNIIEEQAQITGSTTLQGQVSTDFLTGKYSDYHLRSKELNAPMNYHKNERYHELEKEREYRERDFRALEDFRLELESIMQQCRDANSCVKDIANTVSAAANEASSVLYSCKETADAAAKYAKDCASAINDIGAGYADCRHVRVSVNRPASLSEAANRIKAACSKMAEETSTELHSVRKSRELLSDDILNAGVKLLSETDRVITKTQEQLLFRAGKLNEASVALKKYLALKDSL